MAEEIEVLGTWWLPGHEERKVPGTLTFTPEGGARLSLLSALQSPWALAPRSGDGETTAIHMTADALEKSGTYPRILGEADDEAYTLEDCFRTRLGNMLTEDPPERINVNQIFRGAWFEPGEELGATGIEFQLRHMEYWLRWSGLRQAIKRDSDEGEPWATISATAVPGVSLRTAAGATYELSVRQYLRGDRISGARFDQEASVRVSVEEVVALEDVLELASDLQHIVSIGLKPAATFQSVRLVHPDLMHEDRPPKLIDLIVRWADAEAATPRAELLATDVVFTLDDLGGADGLKRWLDMAAEHRGPIRRTMATRYRRMLASDRLINRAAALEALDRISTSHRNSGLRTRLKRCADEAGDAFSDLVHDSDEWAHVFAAHRDEAAHQLDVNLTSTGAEDFYLAESAYWLFVLCCLRRADAPSGVFDRIRANTDFRWLSDRMQPLIGSA